jgi:hypothetical protein
MTLSPVFAQEKTDKDKMADDKMSKSDKMSKKRKAKMPSTASALKTTRSPHITISDEPLRPKQWLSTSQRN